MLAELLIGKSTAGLAGRPKVVCRRGRIRTGRFLFRSPFTPPACLTNRGRTFASSVCRGLLSLVTIAAPRHHFSTTSPPPNRLTTCSTIANHLSPGPTQTHPGPALARDPTLAPLARAPACPLGGAPTPGSLHFHVKGDREWLLAVDLPAVAGEAC